MELCRAHIVTGVLLLAAHTLLLPAQTPAPPQPPSPPLETRSTLVLVPALVRAKSGNLLYTLSASDFALADDGIPQQLRLEQDTGADPLALVVVLEIGGAGAREFDKLSALAPMIDSVVGAVPHRIAVVAFDSQPTLVQDFTSDPDATAATLLSLTPGCTRQHHMENCTAPNPVHNIGLGDNGAAILDALGFSVDLLRRQPASSRRTILLISETLDRGSHLSLDDAVRSLSETNTAIDTIAFSTAKSEAVHYAYREFPGQPGRALLENHHPNPPTGCMGTDPDPDPDATHNKATQLYDCLSQLAPPLALAKMAAIAATDGLRRNVPQTVARLTGGDYFKLTTAKSLETSLATITNHLPNRYLLSFQPQAPNGSPHPGLHTLTLTLPNYPGAVITARTTYWITPLPAQTPAPPPPHP